MKKATESQRLGDRGPAEILGAINYLSAAYLVMDEEIKACSMVSVSASQEVVVETQQLVFVLIHDQIGGKCGDKQLGPKMSICTQM